jgi:methionyl-tRNA formyltransferase
MKILFFLNEDIHAATALNLLLPILKNYEVKIILSKKVGRVDDLVSELQDLRKFEREGVVEVFVKLAAELRAEIFSYENVNSEIALNDFRDFAPDLAVSIRFGQIFKQALINIPRLGVINLHSGILPNYRGVLATFWAVLNGDREIGTTLHFISDAKIDEGEVIGISRMKVDFAKPLVSNITNLYEGGCLLISEVIGKISRGEKIATIKQGEGKYFSYPTAEDVKKFLEIMPLVDLTPSAPEGKLRDH